MAPKKKAKAKRDQAEAVETYVAALDLGKQSYKTADSALVLLLSQARCENCPECGGPRFKNGGVVRSKDGRAFRIRDKFADRDITNVGQNVRRFELEPITP